MTASATNSRLVSTPEITGRLLLVSLLLLLISQIGRWFQPALVSDFVVAGLAAVSCVCGVILIIRK